jgi:hypothetical protein
VTSGGARRGRRDNGLYAAAYAAAGDVDPRVGEHLLDVLAVRGIAAYLQPAADLHPVTRTNSLPSRPTDRLYVDREHLATARGFIAELAEEAPAPPVSEFDEAFAGIVANYDVEVHPTWPEAEEIGPDEPENTVELDQHRGPLRWRRSTIDPLADSRATEFRYADADSGEEEEEGYEPPPPPPFPRPSAAAVVAVLCVLGGLLLFLNPSWLPLDESLSMAIGFTGILTGFVMLILRLRSGDDDDDDWDPDQGAVV